MTQINLTDLEPLVQKALLDSLTEDARTKLLEDALKYLITPDPNHYSRKPISPLQEVFQQAVRTVAKQVAEEVVGSDPRFADGVRSAASSFLTSLDDNHWNTELMEVATFAVVNHLKAKHRDD
jgi:uncharacterized membrane-anchored protein YjiN (DUF445 family)